MYPQYMCILLYVILIWCNGISERYCQLLELEGRCILSICAFCAICVTCIWWEGVTYLQYTSILLICCHLCGVMVFHRFRGICILSICAFCDM